MKKFLTFLFLALLTGRPCFASATRVQEADSLISSDHTKAYALPSGGTQTIFGSVGNAKFQEFPGACNGSNTTLNLANTPNSNATVELFIDGLIQLQGSSSDYTISGSTITLNAACATGQIAYAIYNK